MELEYTDLEKAVERMQGLRNLPTKSERCWNLLMLSLLSIIVAIDLYILFTVSFPA